MDSESINGVMAAAMRDYGKTTRCMAMDFINGMVNHICNFK